GSQPPCLADVLTKGLAANVGVEFVCEASICSPVEIHSATGSGRHHRLASTLRRTAPRVFHPAYQLHGPGRLGRPSPCIRRPVSKQAHRRIKVRETKSAPWWNAITSPSLTVMVSHALRNVTGLTAASRSHMAWLRARQEASRGQLEASVRTIGESG